MPEIRRLVKENIFFALVFDTDVDIRLRDKGVFYIV